MHSVIIVGSGLAGTGAALELAAQGIRPLLLDVGIEATPQPQIGENLYDYRKAHDLYDLLIGDRQQGLANLLGSRDLPVKLVAPAAEYVTAGAETLGQLEEDGFSAVQSFARGGLANAWGAGCYRFTAEDLAGFPVTSRELEPCYDRLTAEIGISGTADDLEPFFGPATGLQPPLPLGRNMQALYRRYRKLRRRPPGIHLGHARVGALSTPRHGRPATACHNLEFFQESPALYSPRYTLDRLVREDRIELVRNCLVRSWREDDGVEVMATDLHSGELRRFTARKLILAAGAINTAKLVLAAHSDHQTTLPLFENPALQLPLILPGAIGHALQTDTFGLVQLNLVWDSEPYAARLQGSLMELTAPSRAEFFAGLPLAARANLAMIRHLLPAMAVMQLFFPASTQRPAGLTLRADDTLRITGHPNVIELRSLRPLLHFLRRLGAWTLPGLITRVPTGHAIHYAGSLPMQHSPSRYECYPDGRLHGTAHVYIADSAAFSALPAKNMSFSMMANAMRIAGLVAHAVTST